MSQPTLPTLILLLPLFSALVILFAQRSATFKNVCAYLSVGSAAICWCVSLMLLGGPHNEAGTLFSFIDVGNFHADIGYILDQKSRGMLFIVTFIGVLVHVYSMDYMKEDAGKARYFGALSLFMFSMTGIVLANNFAMIFVFWELVGLSSYLLIGHWFEKPSAVEASKKAFLVNRIGDFGFMIGILVLWGISGEIDFHGLEGSFGDDKMQGALKSAPQWLVTLAAIGIFMGAVGKSAQVPLHVWLPDAMEGPTPVSALIHAATMVAAGVYMLVRVDFLFEHSADARHIIAGVGGFTALFAALMAVGQNDIKRILAYSTLSQLGYMIMAVGLGAGEAGMFHLYTHAFFKALLFLGAGAVIYACHHEQDIWKMGGLRHYTKTTFVTFVIGTAALMGFPFVTSGFYSKEGILGAAFENCGWLFASSVLTAALTSFYMTRCVVVAFFGKPRSDNAKHAHEAPARMIFPLMLLAVFALLSASDFFTMKLQALVPHEHSSGWVMFASIAALVVGCGGAILIYKGKDKDPLNIPLFANKFYIDEIYAVVVKVCQDRLAWLVSALDSIFADGLVARLPAAIACRVGRAARSLQSGHLQGYTFWLGAGLLLAVYLAVFAHQGGH